MMNAFTSIPAFAKLGLTMQKYLKYIPVFKKLRESGDVEAERELIHKASGEWAENLSARLKISYDRVDGQRISNGPIESVNSRIKVVKQNGNGYKYFEIFKTRVIYALNENSSIKI